MLLSFPTPHYTQHPPNFYSFPKQGTLEKSSNGGEEIKGNEEEVLMEKEAESPVEMKYSQEVSP